MTLPSLPPALLGAPGLAAGTVVATHGAVAVALRDGGAVLTCVVLQIGPTDAALLCAEGDEVLVWCDPGQAGRGVIVGRIGASRAAPTPPRDELPDELVLEAREQLTLKVGDGSITIRADGRILIKGTDLVSHARRQNRIRGGSVSIN